MGDRVPVLVLFLVLVAPAVADDEEALWDRLDAKVVSLEFNDAPFGEVLVFLAETCEATIMIDPELTRNRTEEELRVTVRLKDVTARVALDVVLATTKLGAEIEHGVLVVKDREQITSTSTFEEHDLGGLLNDSEEPMDDRWADWVIIEGRSSSIFEENVAPGTWDPPNAIAIRNGKLFVRHTPEVQEQIRELLTALRAVAARQVEIETSVYRLSLESLAEVHSEGPVPAADILARLDARIARGDRSGDAVLHRLSCVTASGIRRAVETSARHPFVEYHEAWGLEGSAASVARLGWKDEDLRAAFIPFVRDDGAIELLVDFDWTRDVEPGRSNETEAGEIDLPRTRRLDLALRETIPAGCCLATEAGDSTVVFVRPVARAIPDLTPSPRPESEAERQNRESIERLQRTEMAPSFEDARFEDVMTEIADRAAVNIVIDRSVSEQFGEEGLKVRFHSRSISAWQMLGLICDLHGLQVAFVASVAIIATKESCEFGPRPVVRLHDFGNLALDLGRQPVELVLGPDSERPDPILFQYYDYSARSRAYCPEEMAEAIRASVDPKSWDTEGNALRLLPGQLLVINRQETQEKVAAQFDLWRKSKGRPLRARMTRFVAGAGFLGNLAAGVLSAEEVASLSKRLDSGAGTSEVERFTTAGVERQWFGAGRRDQVHYVSRFDPAAGGGTDVRAPVSAWYRTGLAASLWVAAVPEGRLQVEVSGEAARLLGTPSTTSVEGGDIECPRVASAKIDTRAIVAPGEGLLLATGGPADDEGGVEYLLVEIELAGGN